MDNWLEKDQFWLPYVLDFVAGILVGITLALVEFNRKNYIEDAIANKREYKKYLQV